LQSSNIFDESKESSEDSSLKNEDDESDECNEGPVGPGFKDTSPDKITRLAAKAKRRTRNATSNFTLDAMTVSLLDFMRQETGHGILGDDASLARNKVVSSLPTFLEDEVKTLFLMDKLKRYNKR